MKWSSLFAESVCCFACFYYGLCSWKHDLENFCVLYIVTAIILVTPGLKHKSLIFINHYKTLQLGLVVFAGK